MIQDINLFIAQTNQHINELRAKHRNTYFLMSMDFGNNSSLVEQYRQYYIDKGYDIELKQCPRKLWDIIIRWP
jgi:hypothetical protein